MSDYDVGDSARLRCTVYDDTGALIDPTDLTLTLVDPAGTTTVIPKGTLTHASTGVYTYPVTFALAGVYSYTFDASGNVEQVESGALVVGRGGIRVAPWCAVSDIFQCEPLANEVDPDYDLAGKAVAAASQMLFRSTERRYPGVLRSVVRPCIPCGCGANGLRPCGCSSLSEIRLGGQYAVLGIERVRVDGATLVSGTDYRVDDDQYLVRLGGQSWPSCQDLSLAATEPGTWEVTFWYGALVPPDGEIAAAALAAQLYSACRGGACRLPQTVRSRAMQGITEDFVSVLDGTLQYGILRFGIREVDWFLDVERYAQSHRPAVVASPDFPAATLRAGVA